MNRKRTIIRFNSPSVKMFIQENHFNTRLEYFPKSHRTTRSSIKTTNLPNSATVTWILWGTTNKQKQPTTTENDLKILNSNLFQEGPTWAYIGLGYLLCAVEPTKEPSVLEQLHLVSPLRQDLNPTEGKPLRSPYHAPIIPISYYTYCMMWIHKIHAFDHATYTLKNPSYTVDQRNDRLEKELRFPYKETMHVNYSSWL